MLSVRDTLPGDAHYINDIMLKATGEITPLAYWSQLFELGGAVMFVCVFENPVGLVAWVPTPIGWAIEKFCVKPEFAGAEVYLMEALKEIAFEQGVQLV